ncbi:hypothetical protein FALBO_1128 [Fusarium albosuccineum]|uniref:Uncharacterized protein n=1 Tax=Fusarium albosuccineum TaxID=1237068 RepID=A0A8H4LQ45_9HYPO|nr:hypothetical protein FALBO_1128 [Fusarium albosuccineum]
MGKFSFPGRKKQPPKVTVTAPPMSKAQKILGATALNIDAPHQWDEFSSSKVSVAATETSNAPSYASSARTLQRGMREWGDESEIVPRQFRNNGAPTDEYDDDVSDMTSVLRKRQSSSTLHSWYDKSKQPLSISQQTSNSAMAKGLPPKAQRMLDMENALDNAKSRRKKPAKLDLSHIMGRSRSKRNENQPWEGPILGPDQVVRSPSVLSPISSTPSLRGKLTKRPTKESLRSLQSEPTRPKTGDSNRRGHGHLNGLPNLYEHYEQMSFRQVIDGDLNELDEEEREGNKPKHTETQLPKVPAPYNTKPSHRPIPPGHHDEQIVSQYAKRNLPQTPQAILASKGSQSSPTDCAASVSSRHTRTSKASKRTDRSFQESDLQEKSVLSLSSDSEEDEVYATSSMRGHASVPEYATSDAGSSIDYRPGTSRTSESADNSSKRLSRSSKRASFATTNSNYLTIPNGHHRPPPAVNVRSSSLSGSSTNTIQEGTAGQSPSRVSSMSNSSANTTMTWQSKPGFGLQQAKAIVMHSAQGPSDTTTDSEPEKDADSSENDRESEVDVLPARKYVPRESVTSNADQPTPPLSPSSVDFYIRSAHSSVDGHSQAHGSHNRFMAVTRQEEMLLAALRHKRQIMRETILSEMDENVREKLAAPKGHQSKPSEATITESSFDFDFPAPPTCKDKTTVAADGTTVLDLSHQNQPTITPKPARGTPSAPAQPSTKKAHSEHHRDNHQHERILLYLDQPLAAEHSIEEAEPSPDLSDFYEFEGESEGSSEVVSEVILYAQQRRHNDRHSRQQGPKRRTSRPCLDQSLSRQPEATEVGVPRPDSPISPDPLSTVPRRPTVNKKTARLSAVGPAKWGYED